MTSNNPLARHGGLSYLEIPASEPGKSAVFYAAVMGWQCEERGVNDFRFSDGSGHLIGRFPTGRQATRVPGILVFIYVNNLQQAILSATQHGGETVKPPYAEGDVRVATIRDPSGNLIGLWQFA
jgi:predicted enzyme related to lactoylglutathione lyase